MMKTENAACEIRELPAAFIEEMKDLFRKLPGVSLSELPAFLESFGKERCCGLRRNPLKYSEAEFEETMPFSLAKVPWAAEGYFYKSEEQPGKSPLHEAGAFYIQEPSAMIVAELLDVKAGEDIADLCAAPGGKSTQIAGKMMGKGLLVCNEYVPERAKILGQNMERMGVSNCIILNESVERIAERFPLFFDRVLVDAPCSGEGMFRKEEQALVQWSPENVRMCAKRQKEILEEAAKIVKPGGTLVYSTCTFSETEDETVIRDFLDMHREFSADGTVLSEELLAAGVSPGGLPGTVRLWPHKLCGEGHFAAKLIKAGKHSQKEAVEETEKEDSEQTAGKKGTSRRKKHDHSGRGRYSEDEKRGVRRLEQENWVYFLDFCGKYLCDDYRFKLENDGQFLWRREHLYLIPKNLPELGGLRIERGGLYLGEAKKGRFEPSHTWVMTLRKENVFQSMETEDPAVYLRGETLENAGYNGWLPVLFQGKPLGWGKACGNTVKNHYPRGLRRMLTADTAVQNR